MKWVRRAAIVVLILGAPLVVVQHEAIWWWIEVHTGTVNEAGPYYGFWSGFGSDLPEYSILVGLFQGIYVHWKHINCHEPGCPRIGHLMADGHTRSCWHHHPDGRPRPGHVARKHAEHRQRLAGGSGRTTTDHQEGQPS